MKMQRFESIILALLLVSCAVTPCPATVTDLVPRAEYTSTGGATYSCVDTASGSGFAIWEKTDLDVYVDGVLQTVDTDYTVSFTAGDASDCSVTFSAAPSSGSSVVLVRDQPKERTSDFGVSGPFSMSALNSQLDRLTAQGQDLREQVDRSLKLSPGATADAPTLPDPEAGTVLGYNASGDMANLSLTTSSTWDGLADLASTESGKGVDLVAGAARIINAADYLVGTDYTSALEDAIAAAPSVDITWADVVPDARPATAAEIVIPYDAEWTITRQIDIPADKSIRITSRGPVAARLTYSPASGEPANYMFLVKSGWHNVEFDRIAFDGGGIQLEDNVRARNTITRCLFADITGDYAIKVGSGVVDGEVSRNMFSNCGGGVGILGTDSDLWVITHNNFARMRGPAVYTASTGVQIINNNFETMISTAYASPRVQLLNGLCQIIGNRFGDEHTVDGAATWTAPADQIVIGPTGSVTSTVVADVVISENFFLGTNDTASATRAQSAIRLNAPVNRFRIEGNRFAKHYTSLVYEYYYDDDGTTQVWGEKSFDNAWANNVVDNNHIAPLFSEGGVGFGVAVSELSAEAGSETRVASNRVSQDFTTWTATNTSVAVDAVDPAGATNSATTITRTTTGSAYVQTISSTTFSEGAAVFSVWLKAGTIRDVRIAILETTGNKWLASNQRTIRLTDQWQRYYITAPSVPSGRYLRAYIYLNEINDATTSSGTIYAYSPRLEPGLTPTLQPLRTIGAGATANVNTPSGATAYQWPVYDADGSLLGYVPVYGTAW